MKNSLLIAFIFSSVFAHGQISITSADMPIAGDTMRYSVASADSTFLNSFMGSGPAYTWNFNYLRPVAQDVEVHKLSSQTSYTFPNSIAKLIADTLGMGGVEFTAIYEFRKMDSSAATIVGRGITYAGLGFPLPIGIQYTNKDTAYEFPLTYNDRDSNYFMAQYVNSFLGVYYWAKGYRINEVDGYGQITTPYGTFNCIRVVTDVVETDTVHYDTTDFKMDIHLREYKWLAKGEKYPILQVTGAVVSGIFTPALVSYKDTVRNLTVGIRELSQSTNFSVFPNPNSGKEVSITFQQKLTGPMELELLDISGRILHSYSPASLSNAMGGKAHLSLPSELKSGVYFLRLKSAERSHTNKLIINKQ